MASATTTADAAALRKEVQGMLSQLQGGKGEGSGKKAKAHASAAPPTANPARKDHPAPGGAAKGKPAGSAAAAAASIGSSGGARPGPGQGAKKPPHAQQQRGQGAPPPASRGRSEPQRPQGADPRKGGAPHPRHPRSGSAAAPAAPAPSLALSPADAGAVTGRMGMGAGNWYEHASSAAEAAAAAPAAATAAAGQQHRGRPGAGPSGPALDASSLHRRATALLQAEAAAYERLKAGDLSGEAKWMRTVLAGGTSGDKLAAFTLLVQSSPLHTLRHLDALLALARKKSRREATSALEALKDLFLHNLLPDERKLVPLSARASAALAAAPPLQLVWWAFEDALKARYSELLAALSTHLSDPLPHFRLAALRGVSDLLSSKPEGEAALLPLLVNKLGDPEARVAAKAEFLLTQLVDAHEAMKPVVVREVRQFLYRGGLAASARHHAVQFLTQMPLSTALAPLARELIVTYFSLFREATGADTATRTPGAAGKHPHNGKGGKKPAPAGGAPQPGVDTRLLAALLSGINRALPYATALPPRGAGMDGEAAAAASAAATQWAEIEARADALFLAVHAGGSLSTAVQALMLLQQVAVHRRAAGAAPPSGPPDAPGGDSRFIDRYYRALYGIVTLPMLSSTTKHALFLNCVFKSLSADPQEARVRAMLKRLVQVALQMPPSFAAGVILLSAQLFRDRARLLRCLYEPEAAPIAEGPGGAGAVVAAAQKARRRGRGGDSEEEDEKGEEGVAGPGVRSLSAGEERARALEALDAVMGAGGANAPAAGGSEEGGAAGVGEAATAAATAVVDLSSPAERAAATSAGRGGAYDASKRDPLYAGADRSCLWEMAPLALHFHPSVRVFAEALLVLAAGGDPALTSAPASGGGKKAPKPSAATAAVRAAESRLAYAGDPLADFSLMAFLDRYAYKNPKVKYAVAAKAATGGGAAAAAFSSASAAGAPAPEGSVEAELAAGYALVQGVDTTAAAAVAAGLVHGRSAMQRRVGRHGRVDVEAPATSASFAGLPRDAVPVEDRFLHSFFTAKAAKEREEARAAGAERTRGRGAGDEGRDMEGEGEEEEGEEDAFADKLAQQLLASGEGGKRGGPAPGEEEEDALDDWMLEAAAADGGSSEGEEGGEGEDVDEDAEEEEEASDASLGGDAEGEEEDSDDDGLMEPEDDEEGGGKGGGKTASSKRRRGDDDSGEDGSGGDDDDDDDSEMQFSDDGDESGEGGSDAEGAGAAGKAARRRRTSGGSDGEEEEGEKRRSGGGADKRAPPPPKGPRGRGSVYADASDYADLLGSDAEEDDGGEGEEDQQPRQGAGSKRPRGGGSATGEEGGASGRRGGFGGFASQRGGGGRGGGAPRQRGGGAGRRGRGAGRGGFRGRR